MDLDKLFIFIGINVGGWIGWSIGEPWGFYMALFVSTIGAIAGIFVGYKVSKSFF